MPGDKIVATLNASLTGSNGAVIPAGLDGRARGRVRDAGRERPGRAKIAFRVRSSS